MKAVAERGSSVLVQLGERDANAPLKLVPAVVVNTRTGAVSVPRGLDTILAHGYWTEFSGDPQPVLDLVTAANLTSAAFDESKHPRYPAGEREGGRFRAKTFTFQGRDYHKVIDTRTGEPVDVAYSRQEAERKASEMQPDPEFDALVDKYHQEASNLKRGASRKIGPVVIGRDRDGNYYSDVGVGASFGKDPVSIAHWLAGIEINERRGFGAAGFVEEQHPRHPAGSPHGGEFAPKGAGVTAATIAGPAQSAEEAYYKATQPREAVDRARTWLRDNGYEEAAGGNAVQVVQAMQDHYPDGYEFFLTLGGLHKQDFQKNYRQGDTYTPERAKLHAALRADYMSYGERPPAGQAPQALFMAGGSGAGKSTVLAQEGLAPTGSVYINPDDIKERLPDTVAMREAGDDRWAALSHEESSDIAAELRNDAQAAGFPMVIDGTGDSSPGKFLNKVQAAQAAGYTPKVVYVDIPTEEAVVRAQVRAQETGRKVATETIRSVHQQVAQRFTEWRDQVDNWEVWANDDGPNGRRQVARRVDGGPIVVLDPERYAQVEAKANG